MRNVYLIRGLPGSGKTTLAHELLESDPTGLNSVHCEADAYFHTPEGEYKFDASKLGEAHTQCWMKYLNALQKGVPLVIVSNTFTTNNEMNKYVDMAEHYLYALTVIHMENNHGSIHNVPPDTIDRMARRWEKFNVR